PTRTTSASMPRRPASSRPASGRAARRRSSALPPHADPRRPDDEPGQLPLGLALRPAYGSLDVALAAIGGAADEDLQPQGVAAALLQVSSHEDLLSVQARRGLPTDCQEGS